MVFLLSFASYVSNFLNGIYEFLTETLQSIDIDNKLQFLCEYNILVSFIVFAAFFAYTLFIRKDKSYWNFRDPVNIIITIILLALYAFFADRSINLSAFGLGTVLVHPFTLIIIAKLYGPMVAAGFGAAEYIISFIQNPNDPLMFGLFFIYTLGGLIHGLILYERKTSYLRCLWARLAAVLVCNIILIPLVRAGVYTHEAPLSVFIPQTITTNIIQVPIQALLGYVSLIFVRWFRERFQYREGI